MAELFDSSRLSSSSSGTSSPTLPADDMEVDSSDVDTGGPGAPMEETDKTTVTEASGEDDAVPVPDPDVGQTAEAESSEQPSSKQTQNVIRNLAKAHGWPDGPATMEQLFMWQEYNAQKLFGCADRPKAVERVNRFLSLMSRDIDIAESYAGTGNGATTLHQQLKAMHYVASQMASGVFKGRVSLLGLTPDSQTLDFRKAHGSSRLNLNHLDCVRFQTLGL